MTTPELTLNKIQESAKIREVRVSDFLTTEQKEKVLQKREAQASQSARKYDAVDAYVAEVIARFGFEVYQKWLSGEISEDKLARLVYAERAREKRLLLPIETLIVAANAGANNPAGKGHSAPKSLKMAIQGLKREAKRGNENG